MSHGKINRNEPCPCGSGKKYKKCCFPSHEAKTPTQFQAIPEGVDPHKQIRKDLKQMQDWLQSARKAIHAGKLEKAEQFHAKFAQDYPMQIDAPWILAQIREKQERWSDAVAAWEATIRVIQRDRDGFDDETLHDFEKQLAHARQNAQQNPS